MKMHKFAVLETMKQMRNPQSGDKQDVRGNSGDITNDGTNRRWKERRFRGYITAGRREPVP